MVRGRDGVQDGQSRRAAQHLLGQHRVKLDPIELGSRERAGLVPDRVRHHGRAEVVHERRPAERGDVLLGEAEHPGRVGRELGAATAVPAHVRRLEVDEVGDDGQGVVELVAGQHAAGFGLGGQHGVPRLGLASRSNQAPPCATNRSASAGSYVRSRRSRAASRACSGEKRRPIASMSWLRCTTRIASGIASRSAWAGIAVSVPALEREAQRLADGGAEVEPLHEHVGDFAPGGEVVDRPLAGGLLDHADDLVPLVRAVPGRREGHHVPHHLGGIRGVVNQRLGANRDLVAEHAWRPRARGRCSRRTGAAPPSRRSRASRDRIRRPRRSRSRAGRTAAATRAAARTRCPARARVWRRAGRGEAVCPR